MNDEKYIAINDKHNDKNVKKHKGIYVEKVCKSFGSEKILTNVNLEVLPGQICGVVGNNGSGKTVLMKCICGFLKADSGIIYVGGERIGRDVDFPRSLGLIIETPGFLPNESGYKNLKILASLKGIIGKKEIYEAIEKVGLNPKLRKHVSKYSLGMRQRLGIAQAIMENPDILILDEPFNGLDKNGVLHIRKLLKELKNEGKAMILSSHNAVDIEELCDKVVDMENLSEKKGLI